MVDGRHLRASPLTLRAVLRALRDFAFHFNHSSAPLRAPSRPWRLGGSQFHLGSTDLILTATWNGEAFANPETERQSFDPWGERRDPETFVRHRLADTDPFRTSAADYDRGYCLSAASRRFALRAAFTSFTPAMRPTGLRPHSGHEQLDDSGLIHMNGRIYDPELGRMLSPDPFVQVPEKHRRLVGVLDRSAATCPEGVDSP